MVPFYSKAYLSTQVNTSGRLDLVIALYEKTIAHVAKAMRAIGSGDDDVRRDNIHAAAEILMALTEALDFTEAGDLPGRLFALYNYQLRMLLEANRNLDVEPLQSVKSTMTILLNGWQQIARGEEATEIRRLDVKRARDAAANRPPRASFGMMA